MEFLIDRTARTAYVVGNAGVSPVRSVTGTAGLTFLEELGTGAVQTTTIDKTGGAVHSRHTLLSRLDGPHEVFPSQSYGRCE